MNPTRGWVYIFVLKLFDMCLQQVYGSKARALYSELVEATGNNLQTVPNE